MPTPTAPTPDLFVMDDQHPEDIAMLQALYSRSPASVVTHLEKLRKTGSGTFMDQYYVGYGHASIGDCGATTCFIEQVSFLAAKAIQNHPLYNGQEASTRYLDYSRQDVVDPYGTSASAAILQGWKEIYARTVPSLEAALAQRHPFDPSAFKSERVWKNALSARAFDIARSLLPIGGTTLLSWTTTLRQGREHLVRLSRHPLAEIRALTRGLHAKLQERYPHSFRDSDLEPENGAVERDVFLDPDAALRRFTVTAEEQAHLRAGGIIARTATLDREGLAACESAALRDRAPRAALPWRLASYGVYNFLTLLDFGSFRDLQRHRNGWCAMPLVDGRFGFHPWYLEQFDSLLPRAEAVALRSGIDSILHRIAALAAEKDLAATPEASQYLYPMGMQTLVHLAYSLPETVYVAELRSSKTVHPTLRQKALLLLDRLETDFPALALQGDRDADDWTPRRGEQTITPRKISA